MMHNSALRFVDPASFEDLSIDVAASAQPQLKERKQ